VADRVDERDRPASGTVGTRLRASSRRTTSTQGVCGPPMNLWGEKNKASLWSPAPGALTAIRMGT
jgi:hypothetical protein